MIIRCVGCFSFIDLNVIWLSIFLRNGETIFGRLKVVLQTFECNHDYG